MLPKPTEPDGGCSGCPLETTGKGFCPDKPSKRPARYLIIGEAPGKNELIEGIPFIGKAGFVLENWIIRVVEDLRLAFERGEVMIMNTLRCLPPEIQGRAYPKGEDKLKAEAHCRRYDKIPDTVHTVILLGESPQRAWFKAELDAEDAADRALGRDAKGVMGRVGRVYEKDGKRWVFAPHPAFVLRQPSLVTHAQEAFKIASGKDKTIEPEMVNWAKGVMELLSES